ncbi:MAG: TatD family hydrolase [Chitinophagales bacterium]|nr:TatD family hydrolase [Chitinophagales bacterium]
MQPKLIDTHSHLYLDHFKDDITNVMQRCLENGVEQFFLPNIDLASVPPLAQLCQQFPKQCFPMLGLHPCDVKVDYQRVLEEIKQMIDTKLSIFPENKIYAIGECGLDYFWDKTFVAEQKTALNIQAEWALALKLPIVLHTRNSFYDTFVAMKPYAKQGLTGVFHCFTGSWEEAQQVISLENFYMGIGGVLTYKNAGIADVVKQIPLEKLVLETDSPYLTPVPFRGKRNESSYTRIIAEKLAEIKEISLEEVAAVTTANAMRLFGL